MSSWEKFCSFLLKKLGWTVDGTVAPEKVCVLLGVPHTSMWDFVISYLYYRGLGQKTHVLIKKEMFIGPLGWFLRKAGAVPIDRRNPSQGVKRIIDDMKDSTEKFHLAIAPEGTRKPIKKWKTGYHTIARALDCPVYLAYFDWGTKHIGYTRTYPLTDNARKDTEEIQKIYEEMHLVGKHPENYVTH